MPKTLGKIAKAKKFAIKLKAKQIRTEAKTALRNAKHKSNLTRGGLRGKLARARERVLVKSEAKNRIEKMKPDLFKLGNKTAIQTEADVKKTRAKGQALAAAASALGGSYATSKGFEVEKERAKADSAEAGAKALQAQLDSIPDIANPQPDKGSVSGLVTGVR